MQVRHDLLGISWKDCVPGSCFLFFFCPHLAQLDNNSNNNKGPTSQRNFYLPVMLEASAKL